MQYIDIVKDRKANGISQTKLAEFSGFTKQKISAWELNKEQPSEIELAKLRVILDELIKKITKGEINLKGHRNTKSHKIEGDKHDIIKNAEDYKTRIEHLGYHSEYSNELKNLYNKAKRLPKETPRLKGISLFSGCGGLDLGFEAAGIDIVGHVEIWDAANKIYAENFQNSRLLKTDINDVTERDIAGWKKEFGDIDIIVGGPPCQGFSLAGKRDPEDVRSQLYKQYVNVVAGIRPKVFVFENVAKLTSMKTKDGSLFIDEILKEFTDVGYSLVYRIVNAYEYGVPQSRERVILIGVRNDLGKVFVFNTPLCAINDGYDQMSLFSKAKPIRTFRDAMEGLEMLENGESSTNDPLHWAIVHPQHVIEWLADIPEGMSAHDNPDPKKRPPSGFNTTYKRNVWNEPCSTISTNFNMISGCRNVHPTCTRSLTIREATRAQSFPDEFVFCGKWGDIRKAIGNAVPPLLAYEIAKEVINQILGDVKMALIAENGKHVHQIEAGTEGRLKGHRFEEEVAYELNSLEINDIDQLVTLTDPNIYIGNPAAALVEHISSDKDKQIKRLKAYWLGGLATAGQGAELKNDDGEVITGSKSDVVIDIMYDDGEKEMIGVSVKSCKNNAQVALTTSGAFCDMLRKNNIPVSQDAEIGMKMFCGEAGFSPNDGYIPSDASNIPTPRTARPERFYWEELPTRTQEEWKNLLITYQDKITTLILQKANAYKTDKFSPSYILHECKEHTDINDCQIAVMSIQEFSEYSRLFDTFGLKRKRVMKGKYKGVDLAEHLYPHFGFLQFQPIGNKQNFSELQFNLKSNYYKTFSRLKEKV